jgi:hypothetical protein
LSKDVRVDVADLVTLLSDEVGSFAQELQTRNAFEPIIRIWKHFTDISEPAGAEQCVRDRMAEHITIGVSDQPFFMRDFDTAQDQ